MPGCQLRWLLAPRSTTRFSSLSCCLSLQTQTAGPRNLSRRVGVFSHARVVTVLSPQHFHALSPVLAGSRGPARPASELALRFFTFETNMLRSYPSVGIPRRSGGDRGMILSFVTPKKIRRVSSMAQQRKLARAEMYACAASSDDKMREDRVLALVAERRRRREEEEIARRRVVRVELGSGAEKHAQRVHRDGRRAGRRELAGAEGGLETELRHEGASPLVLGRGSVATPCRSGWSPRRSRRAAGARRCSSRRTRGTPAPPAARAAPPSARRRCATGRMRTRWRRGSRG
mmetsp:Transcript_37252/g.64003  ORF Transcript_37252/g.64003 Transcript_37252/m.64003 type:complete len:289 (+) Transcript_37252:781-1647(+)